MSITWFALRMAWLWILMRFAGEPLHALRIAARTQILLDEWTDVYPPMPSFAEAQRGLNELYALFGLNRRTVKSLV